MGFPVGSDITQAGGRDLYVKRRCLLAAGSQEMGFPRSSLEPGNRFCNACALSKQVVIDLNFMWEWASRDQRE